MEWYIILFVILTAAALLYVGLAVFDEIKNRKEKHK